MVQMKMHRCKNAWVDKATVLCFLVFLTGSFLGGMLTCYVDWYHDFALDFSLVSSRTLLVFNCKFLMLLFLSAYLPGGSMFVPLIMGLEGFIIGCLLLCESYGCNAAVLLAVHLLLFIPYGFVLGHWSIQRGLQDKNDSLISGQVFVLLLTIAVVLFGTCLQIQLNRLLSLGYF